MRPGIHPPDALLGAEGGGWGVGEVNSFVWRRGGVTSTAMGVPSIVPPAAEYAAPAEPKHLILTLAQPVEFRAWTIKIFPWSAYEERGTGETLEYGGEEPDGATAVCVESPGPGEWYVSVDFSFDGSSHALFRWHLIVPPTPS